MMKLLRSAKSSSYDIMKKEKEICVSFSVILQTAKLIATVHDNGLVRMEKALKFVCTGKNIGFDTICRVLEHISEDKGYYQKFQFLSLRD